MSKTKTTTNIENLLATYNPKKLGEVEVNYMRRKYVDFEVPVSHSHIENGIIDCVWLIEGYVNPRDTKKCSAPWYLLNGVNKLSKGKPCDYSEDDLKAMGTKKIFECNSNENCPYRSSITVKEEVRAIVCFEIKVSKQDFHSSHGHNFIGNLNYYVMPFELYKEIKNEIPNDIGVITYHTSKNNTIGSLRQQKLATFEKEMDYEKYTSLLHTFLDKKSKKEEKIKRELYLLGDELRSKSNEIIKNIFDDFIAREIKENGFPQCHSRYKKETMSYKSKYCYETKDNVEKCKRCVFSLHNRLKKESDFDVTNNIWEFIEKNYN